jgi:hypothetical protein
MPDAEKNAAIGDLFEPVSHEAAQNTKSQKSVAC